MACRRGFASKFILLSVQAHCTHLALPAELVAALSALSSWPLALLTVFEGKLLRLLDGEGPSQALSECSSDSSLTGLEAVVVGGVGFGGSQHMEETAADVQDSLSETKDCLSVRSVIGPSQARL